MGYGLADAERCTGEACEASLEAIARGLRRKGIKVSVSAQFDYPIYEAVIREAHAPQGRTSSSPSSITVIGPPPCCTWLTGNCCG